VAGSTATLRNPAIAEFRVNQEPIRTRTERNSRKNFPRG
jgi:hypothetical protein